MSAVVRVDVGLSRVEVRARREFGHVLFTVHEREEEGCAVTLVLPWSTAQAAVRSLEMSLRLSGVSDTRGDCPAWCDPWLHRPDHPEHGTDVGTYHEGNQTLCVSLYQPPGATVVVSLYAGLDWNADAWVDLPVSDAATLARQFAAALGMGPARYRTGGRP